MSENENIDVKRPTETQSQTEREQNEKLAASVTVLLTASVTLNSLMAEYLHAESEDKGNRQVSPLEKTVALQSYARKEREEWVESFFVAQSYKDSEALENLTVLKDRYDPEQTKDVLSEEKRNQLARISEYRDTYGREALVRKTMGKAEHVTKGALSGVSRETIAQYIQFEEVVNKAVLQENGFLPANGIILPQIQEQLDDRPSSGKKSEINRKQSEIRKRYAQFALLAVMTLGGADTDTGYSHEAHLQTPAPSPLEATVTVQPQEFFTTGDGELPVPPPSETSTLEPEKPQQPAELISIVLPPEYSLPTELSGPDEVRQLRAQQPEEQVSRDEVPIPKHSDVNLEPSTPERTAEVLNRLQNEKIREHMLRFAVAESEVLRKLEESTDIEINTVFAEANRARLDLVVSWIAAESGDFLYEGRQGYPNLYYINNRDERSISKVWQMHETRRSGDLQRGGIQIHDRLTYYPRIRDIWKFLYPEDVSNPQKFREHLQEIIDNSKDNGIPASDIINAEYVELIEKFLTSDRKLKSDEELGVELSFELIAESVDDYNSSALKNFITGLAVEDAEAALMLNYVPVTGELIDSFPKIYNGTSKKYGYINKGYLQNMAAWYQTMGTAYQDARVEGLILIDAYDNPLLRPVENE